MEGTYTMTQAGKLTDPNFAVDSHGGYCVVRVADSLSVVVINNPSSIEVEVYRNTEDDSAIEYMHFSKGGVSHNELEEGCNDDDGCRPPYNRRDRDGMG